MGIVCIARGVWK